MTDELQKKLIEWAERIGDIASEQLPDFAQQIVMFKTWEASIWFYGAMGFLGFFGLLILMLILVWFWSDWRERESIVGCIGMLILFTIPCCCVGFSNYSVIKKCEVAPKLVILDYIRRS